jgi:uncharacterized membrane protein SpoIIM required for sporulation
VDVDVFVASHQREWERLEDLVRRSGNLSGAEVDELVQLYQRAATHLSMVRSAAPDPALVGRLSALVARARASVTGAHTPALREVAEFFVRRFPAAVYRSAPWWVSVAAAFLAVAAALGWWVAANAEVQATIAAPDEVRALTAPGGAYEAYYSSAPAASFAARVWTNNAVIAAACLLVGVFVGVPVLVILWFNAVNVAVGIGLMTAAGRLDVFLGLVTPHGLLELTAVFVAAGTGLRLGWTVIDPGPRRRAEALAEAGRSAAGMALGLTVVLLISGVIEAFVTPSGLPTWARIGVGVVAEVLFLGYVVGLGRRAVSAGETGDVAARDRGDALPTTVG